jgi:hypothetical protein
MTSKPIRAGAADSEIGPKLGEDPKLPPDQITDAQAAVILPHERAQIGPFREIGQDLFALGKG